MLIQKLSFRGEMGTTSNLLLYRRLSSLLDRYGFQPPPPLHLQNPNPNPKIKKPKKPPYKPPSSLDRTNQTPIHSDLPFDFRFSYTESSSNVKPIGLREPKYSPFGPGRVDRTWTGFSAPAVDPTVRSVDGTGTAGEVEIERWRTERKMVIGEALTQEERAFLIDKCQKHRTKRQINLGRDGLTHNMLNDIHNNWKHAEAVRIKCLGVPTVDMKNVCIQLEEKTGGLIIHRHGGQIILYRGRHYNPKKRPTIPLMLWKPHEPIYPKLIKTTIEGLTIEETKEMRKRGLAIPALTKLAKNGYYASLVPMVRDAFLADELVRVDCKGLPRTDYRKIGVKLRDLVPCILVTFEKEQIVVWRGKDYSSNNLKSDAEILSTVALNSEASPTEKSDIDTSDRSLDDESLVSDAEISVMIAMDTLKFETSLKGLIAFCQCHFYGGMMEIESTSYQETFHVSGTTAKGNIWDQKVVFLLDCVCQSFSGLKVEILSVNYWSK